MKWLLSFTALVLLLTAAPAQAQVPLTLSYQGVLSDTEGNAVPDGDYALSFALYTADNGGEALWSETQTVSVNQGLFHVILGSAVPLNVAFDAPYWMGITVDQGQEMMPRTALTASPYSLSSRATVTEAAPGVSFTVRDESGMAVHVLSAEGDVLHAGVGTFEGGIVAGDSTEAAGKQSTPATGVEAFGTVLGVGGSSNTGIGVAGISTDGIGVRGVSLNSYGVEGNGGLESGVRGSSIFGFGVFGVSTNNAGVGGKSTDHAGVSGESTSGDGVSGTSTSGDGVSGTSTSGDGVSGESTSGYGVSGGSVNGIGVWGTSLNSWAGRFSGDVEVTKKLRLGQADQDETANRFLVWGADNFVKWRTLPTSGGGDGIWSLVNGTATATGPVAVNNTLGQTVTVIDDEGVKVVQPDGSTLAGLGRTDLVTGERIGVFGQAVGPGGLAGVFEGDVEIGGNLLVDGTSRHTGLEVFEGGIEIPLSNGNTARISPSEGWSIKDVQGNFLAHNNPNGNAFFSGVLQAGTKNFKIDHPQDPSGKYLQHVSVESPDMMTVYNGNATTDIQGYATVELPSYFEALNRDFRYQLTVVGQFAQAIIAEEIEDHRFVIQTDKPEVKVSWQVTGIRHDPFAEQYRVQVEVEKTLDERGTYLHPELYRSAGVRPGESSTQAK